MSNFIARTRFVPKRINTMICVLRGREVVQYNNISPLSAQGYAVMPFFCLQYPQIHTDFHGK